MNYCSTFRVDLHYRIKVRTTEIVKKKMLMKHHCPRVAARGKYGICSAEFSETASFFVFVRIWTLFSFYGLYSSAEI